MSRWIKSQKSFFGHFLKIDSLKVPDFCTMVEKNRRHRCLTWENINHWIIHQCLIVGGLIKWGEGMEKKDLRGSNRVKYAPRNMCFQNRLDLLVLELYFLYSLTIWPNKCQFWVLFLANQQNDFPTIKHKRVWGSNIKNRVF